MYYINIVPLRMRVVLMGLVLNYGDRSERWKITTRTEIITLLQIVQGLYCSKAVEIFKCSALCMVQGSVCVCIYAIFTLVDDDMQGRYPDQRKWA